jgi:predicted DsbA family dithiol-disulfide isomerase
LTFQSRGRFTVGLAGWEQAWLREEAMMELTLLTTPACPHREVFEQRLAQALAGRAVTIVRHEVDDAASAQRLGLRGSPTLLIDGTDPFAAPGEPAGVWCRLYRLPDGGVDGAPSVDQLRAALNAGAASG